MPDEPESRKRIGFSLAAMAALIPGVVLLFNLAMPPLLIASALAAPVLAGTAVAIGIADETRHLSRSRMLWGTLIALLVPALACSFLPPAARDELTHHLALPKHWLESEDLRPNATVLVSYFPAWVHVLYAGALSLESEVFARVLHFFFGLVVLSVPFSLRLSRNSDSVRWGAPLAILWLLTPAFHELLGIAYADLPMLAALFAGWIVWVRWARAGGRAQLGAAAFFVGWAVAIKYTALPAAVVFFIATVVHWRLERRRTGGLVGLALLAVVPFVHLLINALATGNPIYPLANSVLGTDAVASGVAASHWQVRGNMFGESLLWQLLAPVRVFFSGLSGSQEHFDGVLNPLWLALPGLLLWFRSRRPERIEMSLLVQFAAICLATVLFASPRARYYLPALVPLAAVMLLLAPQVDWTLKRKQIAGLVCGIGALFGLAHIASQTIAKDPVGYLSGELTRHAYLVEHVPEYGALMRGKNALGEGTRVYPVLTGNRFYYVPAPVFLDAGFLPVSLIKATRQAAQGSQVARALTDHGISHVLYPPLSLQRALRSELQPAKFRVAREFFLENCRPLAEAAPFTLCAISQ